jgi:hypothetical protein
MGRRHWSGPGALTGALAVAAVVGSVAAGSVVLGSSVQLGPLTAATPPVLVSGQAGAPVSAIQSSGPGADSPQSVGVTPPGEPDSLPTGAPSALATPGLWTLDVYDARGVRWQNPDRSACEAAAAQMMLNMATYWTDYAPLAPGLPAPLSPQGWKPDVTYARQESILAYERRTGTMLLSWPGADAHGWRNALNYYGWGSIRAGVYRDLALDSFEEAARATVMAVALYRKPVGILAWAGDHAQIVTGYRVTGEDPRTGSASFTILGVYLTDPLLRDGWRDSYIPVATWKSGAKRIRFAPYGMTNSPRVDPIDGHQGNAEWDGKWVVVAPVA